jgi:hypothetical protein
MAISRALYVGQTVSIAVSGGLGNTYYLPVSSASCEATKPTDYINAFGHLGSLAAAQTNLTTCRSSIKTYLGTGSNGSGLTAAAISDITGDAVKGQMTVVTVTPNGFTMSGIMSSLGVDLSLGSFGTADLSFNGVGNPVFAVVGNASTEQASMPAVIEPVTTMQASGMITGVGCSTSYKFSLDMPTDTLACLGSNPDEAQSTSMSSMIATKPPYKATIAVEGFGVDVSNANSATIALNAAGEFVLGHLGIKLPNAKITSKSFNNAVGNAGATYNFSAEDTTATFTTKA